MKKNLITLAFAVAGVAVAASCITVYESGYEGKARKQIVTTGNQAKHTILGGQLQDFPLDLSGDFASIISSVPVNIVFTQGDDFLAKAVVPKSLYDIWKVKVENGTLALSLPDGSYEYDQSAFGGKYPTVYITNRTLAKVAVSSSGDFSINGPLTVNDSFTYSVSGAGDFTAKKILAPNGGVTIQIAGAGDVKCPDIDAALCRIAIAGTGDAKVGGNCNTVALNVSGMGSINAADLTAETGTANISSTGTIKCNVKNLSKSLSGMGKVTNKVK